MFGLFKQKKELFSQEEIRSLYLKTVSHSRDPEFYTSFKIKDTLPGRYSIVVLHLFLLMNRIGMGDKTSQDLFDIFFYDMDRSMREHGVGDLAVPKRIKKMMKVFYEDIALYEAHIEDKEQLQQALSKTLYNNEKPPQKMVRYVLKQKEKLDETPVEALTSDFNFQF